jgi:hypothetical protein
MLASYQRSHLATFLLILFATIPTAYGQSGSAASITGTVLDPSGAVESNAAVEIRNPVSGFVRTTVTDPAGVFTIPNVPFNPYHVTVTGAGFAPFAQDVDVRSTVPVNLNITLKVGGSTESVTVEANGGDLLDTSTFHTDVDRGLFDKLPLESQSSSLSSLVTLSSPGIAADSNGLFHGMGDHAENSFMVDGQPITDQQSKVFSNQIPLDSIGSMEVIAGAPPAEYGEKTSVVINATTRSGQGLTTPSGSISASYGSIVLQDDVASAIAQQIESRLGGPRPQPLPKPQTVSPEAYETYLKANSYQDQLDLQKSIDYYNQAIKLDPNYAPAYAHMATSYFFLGFFSVIPPSQAWGKVKELGMLAIQKDDQLPEGHAALASAKLHYDWDFVGAEQEFKRALELNPNNAEIRHGYAHYLMAMGRMAESAAESKRALDLDPVDDNLTDCLCWHSFAARQYD